MGLGAGNNAGLGRRPDLRLDPDTTAPGVSGYAFRGPATLPVVFTSTT